MVGPYAEGVQRPCPTLRSDFERSSLPWNLPHGPQKVSGVLAGPAVASAPEAPSVPKFVFVHGKPAHSRPTVSHLLCGPRIAEIVVSTFPVRALSGGSAYASQVSFRNRRPSIGLHAD